MELSYKCRFVSREGQVTEDVIKASTREEAIKILQDRNVMPIQVEQEVTSIGEIKIKGMNRSGKIKATDLAMFCRQLSVMLNAGVPLNRALDIQQKQTEKLKFKSVLIEVSNSIKRGESFSRALKAYPKVFPKMLINLVDVGEATGKLDEVLDRMSIHYTKENRTKNKIMGAMIYPIVLIVMTIVVVTAMMVFIIPQFVEMFASSGVELPGITKFVIAISNSMMNYWYLYILVIGGSIFGLTYYNKTTAGRKNIYLFLLKLPILKKALRQIYTGRFTRTLSTLIESRVPVIQSLSIAGETTQNVLIEESIGDIIQGIKAGNSMTSEINKVNLFPAMMVSMVGIGEETGAMEDLLKKVADYYDEELESGLQRIISLMEPLMIVVIGIVVGTIVVALMMPMLMFSSGATL